LSGAAVYLINLLFGLYIFAVMLRFLLQLVRADFYNPVSQLLIVITNPCLRHLRRWVPGFLGIDWPSIILMIVLQGMEICLIVLVLGGGFPALAGLPVLIVAHLLELCIWIYLGVIIVQILISWVNPGADSPVIIMMYQLTRPLLRPLRRRFPPAGGLDWSPLVAIVLLNLLLLLVVAPLLDLGNLLSGYRMRIL
jgi:YggT family protein